MHDEQTCSRGNWTDTSAHIFGPRSNTVSEFLGACDDWSGMSDATVESLFNASGGRHRLAQEVVCGTRSAGLDINALKPDDYVDTVLVGTAPSTQFVGEEAPELRLLHILSYITGDDRSALEFAHVCAMSCSDNSAHAYDLDELVSRLVVTGLLYLVPGNRTRYTTPPLVRALMRRLRETESDVRVPDVLRLTLQDQYRRLIDTGRFDLDTVVAVAGDIEAWDLLEEIWAEHAFNLFWPTENHAYTVFLAVPHTRLSTSPVLAEARSASAEVFDLARESGGEIPHSRVSELTFGLLSVPTLAAYLARVEPAERRSNAIIVSALRTIRDRRHSSDVNGALSAGDEAARIIADCESRGDSPSRLYSVRFAMELAVSMAAAGDFQHSEHQLHRALLVAENALPLGMYPLLRVFATSALIKAETGHGRECDHMLARYRDLRERMAMPETQTDYIASTAELVRAVDRLDLDRADQICRHLENRRHALVDSNAEVMATALLRLYSGDGGIYAKYHSDAFESMVCDADVHPRVAGVHLWILACMYLATESAQDLQRLLSAASPQLPGHELARARLALSLRQFDEVIERTSGLLMKRLDPVTAGIAWGMRTAVHYRAGNMDEAHEQFDVVLDYCLIAGSLHPIALMPRDVRNDMVKSSRDARWAQLAGVFDLREESADVLRTRLLQLPEMLTDSATRTAVLTPKELSLLFMLERSTSIAAIARDRGLVTGTVKNLLSQLYKKIGVRNRAEAIQYGRQMGYFSNR